jgi:hypothetical protein
MPAALNLPVSPKLNNDITKYLLSKLVQVYNIERMEMFRKCGHLFQKYVRFRAIKQGVSGREDIGEMETSHRISVEKPQ